MDWDALRARQLDSPWRPPIKNALDTSNFEEYEEEDDVEPYVDDGTNWDADF